ncbi:MAG: DUF533 domain-containing protein [Burkholderiales bacterium]
MNDAERRGILLIALFAAFADGAKDERERERIKEIGRTLAGEMDMDFPTMLQAVLLKRQTVHDAARMLESNESKQLAFELAVCVCDADGTSNAAERRFLKELRVALNLDWDTAQTLQREADEISALPLAGPVAAATEAPRPASDDLDKTILNYSVLNGALELLPQSVATMAIIPLQMKMVYRIGKAHGYELNRGHVKDLLARLARQFLARRSTMRASHRSSVTCRVHQPRSRHGSTKLPDWPHRSLPDWGPSRRQARSAATCW